MRRIECTNLVLVVADVDGTLAPDTAVRLGKKSCGNQFPTHSTKEDRCDETPDVLKNSTANNDEGAIPLQSLRQQLQKNGGKPFVGLLLFSCLDDDPKAFGNGCGDLIPVDSFDLAIQQIQGSSGIGQPLQNFCQARKGFDGVIVCVTPDSKHEGKSVGARNR